MGRKRAAAIEPKDTYFEKKTIINQIQKANNNMRLNFTS